MVITARRVREMIYDPEVVKVSDFDRTIFETFTFQLAATERMLEVLKMPNITPQMQESFYGMSLGDILAVLFGAENNHQAEEALLVRDDILVELARQESNLRRHFMPGMERFIRTLRTTSQKAGIASSSPDRFIHVFLQGVKVGDCQIDNVFPIAGVIGSTTIRRRSALLLKPDPFSVYESARQVKWRPGKQIVYFGDNRVDAQTAQNQPDVIGVIINSKQYLALENEFFGVPNLLFFRSMSEII